MNIRNALSPICGLLLLCIFACSGANKDVTITDKQSGKRYSVACDKAFHTSGNPPTTTVNPLDPDVVAAVLSNFNELLGKDVSKHDAAASALLMSIHDSMDHGDLVLVAQKLLYYECFEKVLPLG